MTVCHASGKPFVVPDYNLADPPEDPATCEDCCMWDEVEGTGYGVCNRWLYRGECRYTTPAATDEICDSFESIY